ncbi:unnamed protein product [[Candida] boidinii]|nr:unnamed protein product [[Candida] boidinii]
MVAMLSCILHEHARNKHKPTIPIQTPYDLSELNYSRQGSVSSSVFVRNSVSFDKHRSSVLSIDSNSTVNSSIQPVSYIPHSASFGNNAHAGNTLINANAGSPSVNGITIPSRFVNNTGLPNRISSVATIGSYEGSFKSASPERSNTYFARNIRQQSFSYTPDNFNFSSPVQMPSTPIGLSINNNVNNSAGGLGTSNGSLSNGGPSGVINSGNGSVINHNQLYNTHHQHHPSISSISSKRHNAASLSTGYFNVPAGNNGITVSNKSPIVNNNTTGINNNNNNNNNVSVNITTSRMPKVNITMMNIETLDLYDDVYCMPLLDDLDKRKLNVIRSEYASLLYYWGLPVNRVKILKFNYSDKVNTNGYEFNDSYSNGDNDNDININNNNNNNRNGIVTNFRNSFKINESESESERSGRGSNAIRSVNINFDNYGGPFRDQLVKIGWFELSIPEVDKNNRQVSSGDYFGATNGEFALKLPPGKNGNSNEIRNMNK